MFLNSKQMNAKRRVYYNGGLSLDVRRDSNGDPMPLIVRGLGGRPIAVPKRGDYLELTEIEARYLIGRYPNDPSGRAPFSYIPFQIQKPMKPSVEELTEEELLAELERRKAQNSPEPVLEEEQRVVPSRVVMGAESSPREPVIREPVKRSPGRPRKGVRK